MLRSMRSGVFSGFFLVILLMGGLGLVLSDGGGFFRDGIGGGNVAKIGKENIHITEFNRSLRMVLSQQGVSVNDAYKAGLVHQFLAQELNRAALRQEAKSLGLVLSDKEKASTLEQIMGPMLASGMDKKEAFAQLLQRSQMGEKTFLEEIEKDTTSQILFKAMSESTVPVSDTLATALTQLNTHTRTIKFINLPHNKIKGFDRPNEEELNKYFESVKDAYKTTETRDLSLLVVDTDRLKDSVSISDEEISLYYEENIDQYTTPQKRELHQAIFEDEDTAKSIIDQFKSDLKTTVEDVTGKSDAFVGIQSFTKDELLNDISSKVFDAQNDDIVGPIKTALGWHVFQVTAILTPETPSLASLTEEIKDTLLQEKMSDELYTMAEEMDERLLNGEEINVLVKELPLKHLELSNISNLEWDRLSKLSLEDQQLVLRDAFQIDEDENTPVEQLSDGRFFTVYVHNITPSVVPPFEDVKDRVTAAWTKTKKQSKNFMEAQGLLTKIQEDNTALKGKKTVLKTLQRSDKAPFGLSSHAMETFFNASTGETKMATTNDGIVLGYIESINIPDTNSIESDKLKNTKLVLEQQAQQELMSAYISFLQRERDAKMNEQLLTQYYGQQDQ